MTIEKYNIVYPPSTLHNFKIDINEGPFSWISYDQHEAYRDLIKNSSILLKFSSLFIFSKSFIIILIKRLISYETIPEDKRKVNSLASLIVFLKEALNRVMRKFIKKNSLIKVNSNSEVLSSLRANGVCVLNIGSKFLSLLEQESIYSFKKLRLSRGVGSGQGRDFLESRGSASRKTDPNLFETVEIIMTETGLLNDISIYLGKKIKLVDVNPQINDVSDNFWKGFFEDILSVGEVFTAYFHKDASGGDVKIIFYLSDVNKENGPFSYVLGSQTKNYSKIIEWTEEANDQSGLSATDYKSRKKFSSLPGFLRRKASFGNDITNNSQVCKRILNSTWEITASAGHAVIFDTKGIHRGGMVKNGERRVITCTFG